MLAFGRALPSADAQLVIRESPPPLLPLPPPPPPLSLNSLDSLDSPYGFIRESREEGKGSGAPTEDAGFGGAPPQGAPRGDAVNL